MAGLWRAPERTVEAQAIYAAAEADRAAQPERYALDAGPLATAAAAKKPAGITDDGAWREGFAVYVDAAREEGRLNALGRRAMASTATGRVHAGFSLAAALAADPAVRTRRIDRPLFVIGGWRTGTTLLQRLLGALPGLRPLFPAELSVPWRFAALDEAGREALIDAGESAHRRLHLLNPAMQAVHLSGGRLAEECVLAMGTDMRNWGFTSTLRCPAYAAWLLGQDMAPSYRRYADILRLLQRGDGRRWILKAPAHTAELASLLKAFPDACIVHLHRDTVETVASGASLFATFRSTYSDAVDAVDVGRTQLETTIAWFERAIAARDANPGAQILDIAYRELTAAPLAVAQAVCRRFDIGWDRDSGDAAARQLVTLQAQHRTHRYGPDEFGLEPGEIRERLARYRQRYDVT